MYIHIFSFYFQPIIALLRPADDNDCRPCVNWVHWAFGTVAWCLASKELIDKINIFKNCLYQNVVTCWYKNWKSKVYYIDISLVAFELQFLTCSLEWVLGKLMYHGGPHGSCLFTSCSTSLWRLHWKSTSAVHTRKTKVPLLFHYPIM